MFIKKISSIEKVEIIQNRQLSAELKIWLSIESIGEMMHASRHVERIEEEIWAKRYVNMNLGGM